MWSARRDGVRDLLTWSAVDQVIAEVRPDGSTAKTTYDAAGIANNTIGRKAAQSISRLVGSSAEASKRCRTAPLRFWKL